MRNGNRRSDPNLSGVAITGAVIACPSTNDCYIVKGVGRPGAAETTDDTKSRQHTIMTAFMFCSSIRVSCARNIRQLLARILHNVDDRNQQMLILHCAASGVAALREHRYHASPCTKAYCKHRMTSTASLCSPDGCWK